MLESDWEKAKGVPCPECKRDTLRLIDGMCPPCAAKRAIQEAERLEDRALVRELRRQIHSQGRVDSDLLRKEP